jgi:mannose-6-phosphate isomerase
VPVNKGDVFFIESGTLHAIGEGILIAEVQQNSNTTYRVSDYGRLGVDGKPRELHIDKAIDVTVTKSPERAYGQIGEVFDYEYGTERELANCDFFKVLKLDLDGNKKLYSEDSLISALMLNGELTVKYCDGEFSAKKGDSILIPANLNVELTGKAEVLLSSY